MGKRTCGFAGEVTDADVDADAGTVLFVGVLVGGITVGVGSGRASPVIQSQFVCVRVGVG